MTATTGTSAPPTRLRIRPRVWIGLLIWLGYIVVVSAVQLLSGIPYTSFATSGHNLFFGAGLSLIIASVLLAVTTSALGWWRPALSDRARSRHRWPIILPIIMAVLAIVNLVATDWAAYDVGFFAASLVLLLVGFTEELTTRGLLIVALRSRLGEGWVWFLSSLLFAVMHFSNIALGQDAAGTTRQVVLAFAAGTIFYILRRTTGSLIPAMVLHALWDFSVFALGHGTPGLLGGLTSAILYPVLGVVSVALVALVIRGSDERLQSA